MNFTVKSIAIMALILLASAGMDAQDDFYAQVRFGMMTHTALNLPKEVRSAFISESQQYEVFFGKKLFINEKYKLSGSVGFAQFQFSDSRQFRDGETRRSRYFAVAYGLARKLPAEKLSVSLGVSHYVLAHRDKQDFDQRRVFSNLELGFGYLIKKDLEVSVSSPWTIYPMFLKRVSVRSEDGTQSTRYNGVSRNLGASLGLKYNF